MAEASSTEPGQMPRTGGTGRGVVRPRASDSTTLPEGRHDGDEPSRPLDHVAAGAFEARPDGEITDANRPLARLLGFESREHLTGRSLTTCSSIPPSSSGCSVISGRDVSWPPRRCASVRCRATRWSCFCTRSS